MVIGRSLPNGPAEQLPSLPISLATGDRNGPTAELATQFGTALTGLDFETPQILRPAVGLTVDVSSIVASLVNNVAHDTAVFIGPDILFGIPYSIATTTATASGIVSKVASDTPLDAISVGPFPANLGVWDLLLALNASEPPPGANDPSVHVTPEHPLPIILVNGTFATQGDNWGVGAPVLANAGYKVYTFNYGNITPFPNFPLQSLGDIRESGQELSDEVDRVLAETGAEKVILVGHSQGGGILPAYYINELGGADKVSQVIGIAPSNHGTTLDGLAYILYVPIFGQLAYSAIEFVGPALAQQLIVSPFQEVVYGNGDTRPGVQYTNIITKNDWVVTPYTQQALDGPDVNNIVIQDTRYPGFWSGHANVVVSSVVWDTVLQALADNPEANPQLVQTIAHVSNAA